MADTLLRLDAVSRRFETPGAFLKKPRAMLAVCNVSLNIARGEVVGVVGESGCGKSTLARLALRLLAPSAGTVSFDGTDLASLSPRDLRRVRRRMGMVFQDPYSSLDPRHRVRDAVAEAFAVQGLTPEPGRIDDLLARTGLSSALGDSHPHRLSGGQRQRVGIAQALALSPGLVVLDEPTAALDASIQAPIVIRSCRPTSTSASRSSATIWGWCATSLTASW